ncbi:MAG: flippase [Alphaproteobacteria bacterium]|nr:flippase [Alphaproteobacteria bacterium]
MVIDRFVKIFTNLLVGVWIARYLGPEQFGTLSYAIAFVAIFTVIGKMGFDNILKRDLVENPNDQLDYLGTAFWTKTVGGCFAFGLMALTLPFTSNDFLTNLYVCIIAGGLITQSFEVVEFYYHSQVQAKIIAFCNITVSVLSAIFKIVLIVYGAPLIWFAGAVFLTSLFQAACFYITYKIGGHKNFLGKFDATLAKKMLKDSWPLIFSGLSLMLQARIDQVMLKEMLGSAEVGYYSVCLRIVESLAVFPYIINNTFMPAIISAKQKSQASYEDRFLNFYRLYFVLFIALGLPLYLLAKPIILILFGDAYSPAVILLAVMSLRLFFAHMGAGRNVYLIIENLTKFSLFTMVMGTIVNIAANLWLIPQHGALGAVIATIISFMVTTFVFDLIYNKTRRNVLLQLRSMLTFYKLNIGER